MYKPLKKKNVSEGRKGTDRLNAALSATMQASVKWQMAHNYLGQGGASESWKGKPELGGATALVRDLASRGVQEAVLARSLGLDLKTWRRIREEDPEARAAWEEARALERDTLAGELFRQAIEAKNTTAAIFLLKARHGYRDQGPTDGSSDPTRVAVNIQIPAPLSAEEFAKLAAIAPPSKAISS